MMEIVPAMGVQERRSEFLLFVAAIAIRERAAELHL
jgi:hypothetical protein